MFNPTLRWLADPSHAWLRVPRRTVDELGIADQISRYSYQSLSGQHVYLEEDCDAEVLIRALKARGLEPRFVQAAPSHSPSSVRRLPRFVA